MSRGGKTAEKAVQVNDCLRRAMRELFPKWRQGETAVPQTLTLPNDHTLTLSLDLADDLPAIHTAPDMLTEAFRVVLKNGYEAIFDPKYQPGTLHITSRLRARDRLQITIQDSGIGIRPAQLPHIFEMGWSSKEGSGMGFGLFLDARFYSGA